MQRKRSSIELALDYSSKVEFGVPELYIFEDTYDKCYRDVTEIFDFAQWKKQLFRRKSKLSEKKK